MVLKLHPDKNKNNQEKVTELFKWLNSAYENWRSKGTTANQPHSHTTQTFSSTRHISDRISADKMSRTRRPHSGPSNRAEKKTERTKGQNTLGARGCGEQEKVDGRSRGRQARRQHGDTTQTRPSHCFLERHSGGTQQTGYKGEGKEETGVGRRLPEWRNTNVPPWAK